MDLDELHLDLPEDPFGRLFATKLGHKALHVIGNETRTLDVIQTLSADIMLHAVRKAWPNLPENSRTLFVPPQRDAPPSLLLLTDTAEKAERLTEKVPISPDIFEDMLRGEMFDQSSSDEAFVRREILSNPNDLIQALRIAQPEVVVAPKPRMERLCVPSPFSEVKTVGERSTVGIYCRDSGGRPGVTACFHGTGPEGTKVWVAGRECTVAAANPVQDIVFIPLPDLGAPSVAAGIQGVLSNRTPSQYDSARFEGATSGSRSTSIASHDAALLRRRPTVQLKVQTPADTNKGDSGSALIDSQGQVIGFAFEKSAFGEVPQITDWIWAANALAALQLSPL